MSCAERLRQILDEPLAYLHPQRLELPAGFENAQARHALDQLLLDGLGLRNESPSMPLSAVALQWVKQWRQLPEIARLMGAWRMYACLAQGGRLQQLPRSLRRFAGCRPGPRVSLALQPHIELLPQIEAAGFNALSGLREFVPASLLERLALQFSPEVVDLHAQWPQATADTTLFFLAVQHARLHPQAE